MPSLVREFQHDLISSGKSTTQLLRTAKLISSKLGLANITTWLTAEMQGYHEVRGVTLPPYRIMNGGDLMVLNPVRGWQLVGHVKKEFGIGQSISEIEDLLAGPTIVLPLHGADRYPLSDQIGGRVHFEQQLLLSKTQVRRIVDAVREKLLDWSSELESRGILGNDMTFDPKEQRTAQNQVFNIQHATGIFGNVSKSHVEIYDYGTVHQTLKDRGISQEQRNELENLMDGLKKARPDEKSGMLERAKDWVTRNADFLGASATVVRKALGLDG